jgi:hypothetical protein
MDRSFGSTFSEGILFDPIGNCIIRGSCISKFEMQKLRMMQFPIVSCYAASTTDRLV